MLAARPAGLPLFPLNTVLFPGGLLPLKIFEQRYLAMTKTCIRDGTPFGVCRIVHGQETGPPASHELIGCTASIVDWDMPHLGLFQLRTRGGQVFRVCHTSTRADGLIEADIELITVEAGSITDDHVGLCRRVLEKIVERIGSEWFFPPARFDLSDWIGYRLAEALPLSAEVRQRLLALPDGGARLSLLHALIVEAGIQSP